MSTLQTNRFDKLYELNQQLHELAAGKMKKDMSDLDNRSFFAVFIVGKAYKTHEATLLLCKEGYGEDAFVLSRTLFELMILISYVLEGSTDGRVQRYVEYDWVVRKEMLNYAVTRDRILDSINREIASGAAEADVLNIIEKEYKRVQEKYRYEKRLGWSDKNISQMAESVGRGDTYKSVYKLQCTVAHSNARSMNEYIKNTNEGTIVNIGPSINMTEAVLITAFDFFGIIFEQASKQLKWNVEQELDSIGKAFSEQLQKP